MLLYFPVQTHPVHAVRARVRSRTPTRVSTTERLNSHNRCCCFDWFGWLAGWPLWAFVDRSASSGSWRRGKADRRRGQPVLDASETFFGVRAFSFVQGRAWCSSMSACVAMSDAMSWLVGWWVGVLVGMALIACCLPGLNRLDACVVVGSPSHSPVWRRLVVRCVLCCDDHTTSSLMAFAHTSVACTHARTYARTHALQATGHFLKAPASSRWPLSCSTLCHASTDSSARRCYQRGALTNLR